MADTHGAHDSTLNTLVNFTGVREQSWQLNAVHHKNPNRFESDYGRIVCGEIVGQFSFTGLISRRDNAG